VLITHWLNTENSQFFCPHLSFSFESPSKLTIAVLFQTKLSLQWYGTLSIQSLKTRQYLMNEQILTEGMYVNQEKDGIDQQP
jgi:hypothetical protein